MATVYYSRTDLAAYIGVKVDTLAHYKLPAPDVIIGLAGRGTKGWSKHTIDAWQAQRPGRGRTRTNPQQQP